MNGQEALCRLAWIVGVNQIVNRLVEIWLRCVVGDTTG